MRRVRGELVGTEIMLGRVQGERRKKGNQLVRLNEWEGVMGRRKKGID